MGSYVDASMTGHERIIQIAKIHWMFLVGTCAGAFGIVLLGLAIGSDPNMVFWENICYAVAGVFFVARLIQYLTTEIALTSRRLVYKKGFIARSTAEISLNRLEEINMRQGILDRIFGAGRIRVAGTGIGSIELPPIGRPLRFRAAIQDAQQVTA